jgi:hypothetical protein
VLISISQNLFFYSILFNKDEQQVFSFFSTRSTAFFLKGARADLSFVHATTEFALFFCEN